MNILLKRGVTVGAINLILGFVLNAVISQLLPAIQHEYQTGLFRPWSDPLMMIFFFYPFVVGFALAYLFEKVEGQFLDKNPIVKAGKFAVFYFCIATLPGMFISYTTFTISFLMVSIWTISGFLNAWIAGYIFTRMRK